MKYLWLAPIIITLAFSSGVVVAADKITVVSMSPRASAATPFGMAVKSATKGRYYQSANCEDALRKFNATDNSVLIYNSSMEFAGRNKGLDCRLDSLLNEKKVMFVGQVYMKICQLAGNNYGFGKRKTSLGMASMYAVPKHQAQWVNAGANLNIIPFAGAKAALRGLYAEDIELAWLSFGLAAKQKRKIDCIGSTDPEASDFFGKQLPGLSIPDFRITYVILVNSNNPEVIQRVKSVENSTGWKNFMQKSYTTGSWNVSNSDAAAVVKYVDRMETNWAD